MSNNNKIDCISDYDFHDSVSNDDKNNDNDDY